MAPHPCESVSWDNQATNARKEHRGIRKQERERQLLDQRGQLLQPPFHGHSFVHENREVNDLVYAVVKKGGVVGFDVSEVAPPYDHADQTSLYAAQIILDFICFYTKKRSQGYLE